MQLVGVSVSRVAPLAVWAGLMAAKAMMACSGAPDADDQGSPGIADGQALFGQSAALRGPAGELGRRMRLGIRVAFHEVNRQGGVHGLS